MGKPIQGQSVIILSKILQENTQITNNKVTHHQKNSCFGNSQGLEFSPNMHLPLSLL